MGRFLLAWMLIVLTAISLAQGSYGSAQGSSADKKQLASAQKAYDAAKAVYLKSPKDAAKKSKYVAATVNLATTSMNSPALDRKVKYRQALKYYREALKLDPKNAEAKQNSEMIIAIYKSMGRPIPN